MRLSRVLVVIVMLAGILGVAWLVVRTSPTAKATRVIEHAGGEVRVDESGNVRQVNLGPQMAETAIESLRHFRHLKKLNASKARGITNLRFLEEVPDIEELHLPQNVNSFQGAPIKRGLKAIAAGGTNVRNLRGLSNFPDLEWLFCGPSLQSLDGISGAPKLRELFISGAAVSDLSTIRSGGSSELRILDISATQIQDLKGIEGCHNLTALVAEATRVSDLTPLGSLSNLGYLNLSGSDVKELSPLKGLEKLYELNVSETPVSILRPLRMSNIETLDASNSALTSLDGVEDMESLKELRICDNGPLRLEPLLACKRLKRLYLGTTPLAPADIEAIASLEHLSLLSLDSPIERPLTLARLRNLEVLQLGRQTGVAPAEVAELQERLPKCSILVE